MRPNRAAAVAAILAVFAVLTPVGAASAAEPVVPVTPIPDLPSNTIRMTPPSTAGGSWTASDWWRAVIWKSAQPGTEVATLPTTGTKVATVPKPITAAATLTRGAAGGPLVGAFMGGFAIGQGGLQLYGAVTGDDPLDEICGSGWEGVGSVLYVGMMPDCQGAIDDANADVTEGTSLNYGGTTLRIVAVQAFPREDVGWGYCLSAPATKPSGVQSLEYGGKNGAWSSLGGGWLAGPTSWCTTNAPSANKSMTSQPSIQGHPPKFRYLLTNGTYVNETTVSSNPTRTPRCQISWEDGTTTSGTGSVYTETQGFPLSSAALGCKSAWDAKPGAGPDLLPRQIDVDSEAEGGAITEIATQTVPDMAPEQRRALEAVPGNGRGLVLEKTVDGSVKSCNTWEVDCAQWWTETGEGTTPGTYRCTFGGNVVSLTECGPYRHTFDAPTTSPTITDPSTGQPVPWSGPGVSPGTIADGVTGGGACGAAWSWNPVDWVLNPLKCAFIPSRASVTTMTTTLQTSWLQSTPGQLSTAVGSAGVAITSLGAGTCGGIIIPFPEPDANGNPVVVNRPFMAACPGDFFEDIARVFFWLCSGSICIYGFFAIRGRLDALANNQ